MGGVFISVMGGNNSEADREGSERTVVDDEVAPQIVVENTINHKKGKGKTKFGGAKSGTGKGPGRKGKTDSSQLKLKQFFGVTSKGNSPGSSQN